MLCLKKQKFMLQETKFAAWIRCHSDNFKKDPKLFKHPFT